MGFPERPVVGQDYEDWAQKLDDWMAHVESILTESGAYISPIFDDATIKGDLYVEGITM